MKYDPPAAAAAALSLRSFWKKKNNTDRTHTLMTIRRETERTQRERTQRENLNLNLNIPKTIL